MQCLRGEVNSSPIYMWTCFDIWACFRWVIVSVAHTYIFSFSLVLSLTPALGSQPLLLAYSTFDHLLLPCQEVLVRPCQEVCCKALSRTCAKALSRGCGKALSRGCAKALSRTCGKALSRGCGKALSRTCAKALSRTCAKFNELINAYSWYYHFSDALYSTHYIEIIFQLFGIDWHFHQYDLIN